MDDFRSVSRTIGAIILLVLVATGVLAGLSRHLSGGTVMENRSGGIHERVTVDRHTGHDSR